MRNLLADVAGRFRGLLHGAEEDEALREEMQFHVEMEQRRNEGKGMTPAAGARAARLRFGSDDRWVEESRDARGARALTDFARDLRLAGRDIRRRPAFAFVAVLTLAAGMAGVTAVFSVTNRVLLRPLAGVEAPDRLVTVRFEEDQWNDTGLSYLNFQELASSLTGFDGFAGYVFTQLQVLPAGGRARVLEGVSVLGDYFGTLRLVPAHGRFFGADELGPAAANVAVISHRMWQDEYGGGDVVGSALRMNGHLFTIIGVAPHGFSGAQRRDQTDIWLPPAAYSDLRHFARRLVDDRSADSYRNFFARLAPGVTVPEAEQELTVALERLRAGYSEIRENYERSRPRVYAGVGLAPEARAGIQQTLKLMFAVAAVVLLIACANAANLLVFRAIRARGESAVRRALGASTLRILQHHTTLGLILTGAGSAFGLTLALLLLRSVGAFGLPGFGPIERVPIDARVLSFAIVLALLMTVLFAAVPTLWARRWDLVTNLRDATRTETGRMSWVRNGLAVLQLALSASLVIPAALLARSVWNLNHVQLGFNPDDVYAFYASVEPQGYSAEHRVRLQQRLLETLRADQSIVSAAISSAPPFSMGVYLDRVRGPAQEDGEPVLVVSHAVSDGLFTTLSIPYNDASHVATAEAALRNLSDDAVVLSRSAAELLYGNGDVMGRTYIEEGYRETSTHRVVGVVADTRITGLREAPRPAIYRSISAEDHSAFTVLVRSRVSGPRTEAIVTSALAAIDPALPFAGAQPLRDSVDRGMAEELLFARLTGVLGALAALLAGIGLYGLMGYSVAQRTREIGIRMALGARATRVVLLVTGETMRLTVLGLALGCVGGWALARVLQSKLFGVSLVDGFSYAAAVVFIGIIGIVAAAVPARNAAAVQPSLALKSD